MTILHVPQGYWPVIGGSEILATKVSEGLAARGHAVRVLVANVPDARAYEGLTAPPLDAPRQERRGGVRITRYPLLRVGQRTWNRLYKWPIPGRGTLRRHLRRRYRNGFRNAVTEAIFDHDPFAVLTMPHFSPNVVAVVDARRQRYFPLVYSPQLHDDQPGWRHGLVRDMVHVADWLTANTRAEAAALVEIYGADPKCITVTGCGVDDVAEVAPWPRARRVVCVGRKTLHKGVDLLLDAMRILWERGDDVELVLAGARVPDTEEVDELVAALPDAHRRRLRNLDDVTEEEKDELLRGSAALVLPSRYESFGIVLLEAWRHGTPVVALDRPATAEVVRHEATGLVARSGDAASLAAALVRLLDDPALAERLGRAGHAEVAEHHTWAHVAERYEEALLQAHGGIP